MNSNPRRQTLYDQTDRRWCGPQDGTWLRLEIVYQSIDKLKPNRANSRTHSKKQIKQLADCIQRFGFLVPIIVDGKGRIIAGHCRLAAAKLLGMTEVPTVLLEHMTEGERRAYALADNRLAELAGWDQALLADELRYLTKLDLSFDLTIPGFDAPEIDLLLQGKVDADRDAAADQLPPIRPDEPSVSQPGDLWVLGRHRISCADAREQSAYRKLLGTKKADIVFADPPYNVPIANHVSGLGRIQHREFAMASGEMSEPVFIQFLETFLSNCAAFSRDGSIHYVCIDWRHLFELLVAGRKAYAALKNLCVWAKTNAGMGSLYRSQHELIAIFKNGTAPHVNNIELGRHGRSRSNLWTYSGMNSFGAERAEALATHPTVKPVALVADALLDCSRRGAIVLDPFLGSGTTIIAAERTGRCAYGLEIEPQFVDATIRRYEAYTGDHAINAATGSTFREMAERSKTIGDGDSEPNPKRPSRRRQKSERSDDANHQVPVTPQSRMTPDAHARRACASGAKPKVSQTPAPARARPSGKARHA